MPKTLSASTPSERRNIDDCTATSSVTNTSAASYVRMLAPSDEAVCDYDRHHLALYAALLDADDSGQDWQDVAATLMRIDVTASGAKACWRTHLERARWIIGEGLEAALTSFGARPDPPD